MSEAHKDAATPICVTVVISVGTYFVVFNLKLLISTFRPLFDGPTVQSFGWVDVD